MIRQYQLKNVYGRLSEAARKALIDFWIGWKVQALTVENPKLAKTLSLARFRESGATHIIDRLGILYAGKNRFGHDLWYRNFSKE